METTTAKPSEEDARDMPRGNSPSPPMSNETKQTYKSFKKKYRKMRAKFEEKMRQSNDFFMQEQAAIATAKRLAQENDRILDMLLDVNNSAQIPADKRIDLMLETPSLNPIPPLITPSELSLASTNNLPDGQALYTEIQSLLSEKASTAASITQPSKSPPILMTTVPHLSRSSALLLPDLVTSLEALEGHPAPLSYLTLDQQDDHLLSIDASIGLTTATLPAREIPSPSELMLKNPHSVYNWLRQHEPKIFLQDGEGSEKSMGKPGALRGAGKRASIPAPSKPDALEIVEEDGMGYDVSVGGPKQAATGGGKRKRGHDDDDGTGSYTPKSGRVDDGGRPRKRNYNRKRKGDGGDGEAESETKTPTGKAEGEVKKKPARVRTGRSKAKEKSGEQASAETQGGTPAENSMAT